ncbi:MAG: sigma-54-dependent Fis family transcriptional regulator [Myxococcaceae bacterium]|nr:sigma-54-dependent Fis family transcriptional regulator [Myxococcaceae bacterium]
MEPVERKPEQVVCRHCGLLPATSPSRNGSQVVCESPKMQELFQRTARFARNDAPVVIIGESGSGKEVVARTLHANSERADEPFVAVNVAALPDELLESELFGHVRGAFTGALQAKEGLFEAADGGTLFLDEIGELPLALQAKLLRALQEGEIRRVGDTRSRQVDVRVVCATHRALDELVQQKLFREDLYYRLKVLTLRVPPLRERVEDILPLARGFLAAERTPAVRFSPAAERVLQSHRWPGNVRELQNAVKHAAALATGPVIGPELLPEEVQPAAPAPSPAPGEKRKIALRTLEEVEREYVLDVLAACGGAMTEAARVLGVGRNTLWRKLKRYG